MAMPIIDFIRHAIKNQKKRELCCYKCKNKLSQRSVTGKVKLFWDLYCVECNEYIPLKKQIWIRK